MNVRYIIFTLIGILIIISFNCAHLKEAQQAYSEKQYQQTITLCQTAIQTDSTDAEAYFLTGKCYHALKKPLKALPFTLKAYELNPSSNKIQSALIDLYAQKNNDPNRALYYFKKAEIINPAHFYLIKKIGNLSFKQGYLEHAKERYILLQNEYPDSSKSRESQFPTDLPNLT